jgi:hypothetical protein
MEEERIRIRWIRVDLEEDDFAEEQGARSASICDANTIASTAGLRFRSRFSPADTGSHIEKLAASVRRMCDKRLWWTDRIDAANRVV